MDEVLWGGLQYADGDLQFGVRKSMFYWEPDSMPAGTYSPDVEYGGWSSWNKEHAHTVGRSYDYPHVAAAYWVLYRLARDHEALVTGREWPWHLERAYRTGLAMVEHAPRYAQFGQMDGTVFLLVLLDLKREGWTEEAAALEAAMRARADVWRSLGYPYGSEMPWDSTGQEEVYAWCRYFGFDDKAAVTLNAILGYMPTVPQLGLQRKRPAVLGLPLRREAPTSRASAPSLRLGIERHPRPHGVPRPSRRPLPPPRRVRRGPGVHRQCDPRRIRSQRLPCLSPRPLRIDGYSGDYGPGFFGHAVNTGTYLHRDPDLGWLGFGGNVEVGEGGVAVLPTDASGARVYLGPLGLWLTLDAGPVRAGSSYGVDGSVVLTLAPAGAYSPTARLRVAQPGAIEGASRYGLPPRFPVERERALIPLGGLTTQVILTPAR